MRQEDGEPRRCRPRVLQVITHLDMGGAERVAVDLIERLADEVDFSLFAVLSDGWPNAVGEAMASRLDALGVPHRFGVAGRFKSGGVILAIQALAREVARFQPDMVHLHTETPELTFALGRLLCPALRRPAALRTVHNVELWPKWDRLGRWVTRRLADADVVAVSEAAADADRRLAHDPRRGRAVVVPNAVTVPRTVLRTGDDGVRLLFAGRLVQQKGADLLPAILAAAHARTARRDVALTIAGSGELADAVRRDIAGVAAGWQIAVVPPIADLADRLGEWDAVLLPSRFEGFGLTHLEAMLAGVPLVTARAPGLAEVLPHGYPLASEVGDVDAIGAALAAVIDDAAGWRARVAGYAPPLAERFSPVRMASSYRTRYRAAMEGAA